MRLGIGAIFKNEGPYVLEWLGYHMAIGVTDFFIADHESNDGTSELLEALDYGGWITRIPFRTPERVAPQMAAYREILSRFGGEVDWMAFIDGDEFINQTPGMPLPRLIRTIAPTDSIGAIAINWATYGSSGQTDHLPGLVIERFTRRGPMAWFVNRHYKSIVRPSAVADWDSPHHAELKPGFDCVQADGRLLQTDRKGLSPDVVWGDLRLNHYVVKSLEEFRRKQARGRATTKEKRPDEFFVAHDRNECMEPIAKGRLDLTRENMSKMAFLLGDIGGWNPHVLTRVNPAP